MGIFASFLVPLEPVGMRALPRAANVRDALLPRQPGSAADRELRADLHDEDRGRPLTISDPFLSDRGYVVRVTALRADLAVHVIRALGEGRKLGDGLRVLPVSDWSANVASADELTDDKPASGSDRIGIRLLTPTTLRGGDRHGGRMDVPLPDPTRVVGSWLARLETCAEDDRTTILGGVAPQALVDWVRASTSVAGFGLYGEPAFFTIRGTEHRVVATRGWLVLNAESAECPERRALRALGRLSCFSGTGRKTVHGFGQTLTVVNGLEPKGEERALDALLAAHQPFGGAAERLLAFV
jgi:hypothetical protein